AALDGGTVTAARGVRLVPDVAWDTVDPLRFDALVLPGGAGGTRRFCAHAGLLDALRNLHAAGRWIAAVCAAPLALQAAGILAGRRATCHPDVADKLSSAAWEDVAVVMDGNLITSQGAGTSIEFGLALIERLCDRTTADRVATEIVLRNRPARA
ncbi:MAG: DJ-1/PfpI family protein, partial [Verrucomicrobia bacterium]|nr:DJ-1/PfpI family protein [Verrucomicrobiota bacterium]